MPSTGCSDTGRTGIPCEQTPEPVPPKGRWGDAGRWIVLAAAFLGWFCAGMLMSTTSVGMRAAAIDLLARDGSLDRARFQTLNRADQQSKQGGAPALNTTDRTQLDAWKAASQSWFAYFQCAMLLGAAAGGFLFGMLGDRIGRSRALAASILCYSILSAAAAFVQSPIQLVVVWFAAALGIGGVWPNGVALLSETWSDLSRPLVAGIMGTAANVGIFGMATLATYVEVTADSWRWMLLADASPVVVGLLALVLVPESPRWLAARAVAGAESNSRAQAPKTDVFRPPLLQVTLVGILLATIPLIGGWGSANWMVPWAGEAGEAAVPPNPYLQAQVNQARALTGIVGSLLGGWVAHIVGRRRSYWVVSLLALACAQYAFWFMVPTDRFFLLWVSALGFFSGLYFGWLPLFLPELFPTRARSTGSGVSFNSGRILTAATIFATGVLVARFGGDYPRIGRITSLVYALGIIAIWLAPDTSRRQLED